MCGTNNPVEPSSVWPIVAYSIYERVVLTSILLKGKSHIAFDLSRYVRDKSDAFLKG